MRKLNSLAFIFTCCGTAVAEAIHDNDKPLREAMLIVQTSLHQSNHATLASLLRRTLSKSLPEHDSNVDGMSPSRHLVGGSCFLCYDGSEPLYPNATVPDGGNTTCAELDASLQAQPSDPLMCDAARMNVIWDTCGCPEPPPGLLESASTAAPNMESVVKCSGICVDGSTPIFPDALLPLDVYETGQYTLTCSFADFIIRTLDAADSGCSLLQSAGSTFCGCPASNVTEGLCSPCYGNAPMPDFNKKVVFVDDAKGHYHRLEYDESFNYTFHNFDGEQFVFAFVL